MPKEGLKVIDVSEIPGRVSRKQEEWVKLLKSIPKGKAIVGTEDELSSRSNLDTLIKNYTEKKLIPKGYRVVQRTVQGKPLIYIMRQAEPESTGGSY